MRVYMDIVRLLKRTYFSRTCSGTFATWFLVVWLSVVWTIVCKFSFINIFLFFTRRLSFGHGNTVIERGRGMRFRVASSDALDLIAIVCPGRIRENDSIESCWRTALKFRFPETPPIFSFHFRVEGTISSLSLKYIHSYLGKSWSPIILEIFEDNEDPSHI